MDNESMSNALSADNTKKRKASKKANNDAEQIIRDALLNYLKNSSDKFYKEDCAKAVAATLQEFMQAFILIGYDFHGTPIKIIHAHNGQEADALSCAMQKFMMQNMRFIEGE